MQFSGLENRPLLISDKTEKLPISLKVSFGFGHVFNDLCAAMWFSYTLFYLQIILQMRATTAGILLMIGQVADALATPMAGYVVDKFGNRKTWHFAGTVLIAVSFPLVFTICTFCENMGQYGGVIYYTVAIILFQIGWATVQISHLSMIPNLTSNGEHRSELTAIRYTAAVCSSVVVYIVTWVVLDSNTTENQQIGPDDYYKFKAIILIVCAIGLTSSFIFYYGVKCKETLTELTTLDGDLVKPLLRTPTLKILATPLIYQVSLLYVASRLYMTLNLVYMPLYLDERVSLNVTQGEDIRESLASVPLLSFLASFLASLVLKYKASYCGNKVAYLIGSAVSLIACIWIGFCIGPETSTMHIYVVAVLIGMGSSTTMVSSLCLTAEMIGLNSDKGASVYSIVTFMDKLICGIAVVVVEHMKCSTKSDCPEYYRYVLAFVSGGAVLLGLIILSTLCVTKAQTFIKQDIKQ